MGPHPSGYIQVDIGDVDDPVDPKTQIEELCKPKCEAFLKAYEACAERIEGDETGEKHCTGQYFDFWSCVDHCAVGPTMKHTS
jgi:ubiquinol-cytochrome c reductase subunit 6